MAVLFQRDFALTVDTLRITKLDVSFQVVRNLSREPNTADITIRNLNPDHRAQLAEKRSARVVVEAGYTQPPDTIVIGIDNTFASSLNLIFNGDLREVWNERDGASVLTRLTSGDGEKKRRSARVNRGFGKGTSLKVVIEACAAALGVGAGNLNQLTNPEFPGAGAVFSSGTVVTGNAAEVLGELLNSAGLTYSIQDGQLQILRRRQALAGTALVLSPSTGMVDVPSVSSDGTIRARTLMIPDLFPGRKVELRGENVTGFALVQTAKYTGDTASAEWFIDVECKRLQ